VQAVAEAHALDHNGSDTLGVHHGLEGSNILGQEVLVDAPKHPEKRAERRTCPFAAVAVHFAPSITIIIPSPFLLAVADRGVLGVQPDVIAALIGEEQGSFQCDARFDNRAAARLVSMLDHPVTVGLGGPTDDADNRRAVVLVRATSLALVRPSAWWISLVGMLATFFPPRSGTPRRPRTRDLQDGHSAAYRRGSAATAAGSHPGVYGRCRVHVTDARSTRL
jgi:hypothetical protein